MLRSRNPPRLARTDWYKKAHIDLFPGTAQVREEAGGNMFHCRRTGCPSCVRQWQFSLGREMLALLIHPKAFPRNVKAGNSFTIPMPHGSNSISEPSAEVFSKEAV